ncbi:MAG: hypothetical protein AAF892_09910 [Cyanobacteria bacterium P01_D01_bin.71]
MSNSIKPVAIATLLSLGLGTLVAPLSRADMGHDHGGEQAAPTTEMSHGDDHDSHEDHSGHHGLLMIPEGQPVPEIVIDLSADPVSGWNLQVQTANWSFAPAAVNTASNTTEGHAHLYINGEKVTRIYGEWYHIPSLPPGEHVLTVGLNANGHEALVYEGELIEASVDVLVPDPAAAEN